jgi:hypothetical protein
VLNAVVKRSPKVDAIPVFHAQRRAVGREMEWVESSEEFLSRGANWFSPLAKGDQGGCIRVSYEQKNNPLNPPLLRGNNLTPIWHLLKREESGDSMRGVRELCR